MVWRRIGSDLFRLLSLVLVLALVAACAGRPEMAGPFAGEPARESRWSAVLNVNGESTPLTVIILTGAAFDGRARVVILSAFGAALGDCRLTANKTSCRNAAPGASALTDKVMPAIKDIFASGSGFPDQLTKARLNNAAWEAEITAEKITYRKLTEPQWELVMNRLETR